jgi:hypothetical protein
MARRDGTLIFGRLSLDLLPTHSQKQEIRPEKYRHFSLEMERGFRLKRKRLSGLSKKLTHGR